MALKVKINEVLRNKLLMDYFVSFNRNEYSKWMRLFEGFEYEKQEDLLKETNGGNLENYAPAYVHIAEGEYGNCVLVLYRSAVYRSEDFKALAEMMLEGLGKEEQKEVLEDLEAERYRVFGMYSYAYKGMIETEWFSAFLKEEIEIKL